MLVNRWKVFKVLSKVWQASGKALISWVRRKMCWTSIRVIDGALMCRYIVNFSLLNHNSIINHKYLSLSIMKRRYGRLNWIQKCIIKGEYSLYLIIKIYFSFKSINMLYYTTTPISLYRIHKFVPVLVIYSININVYLAIYPSIQPYYKNK